MNVHHQDQPRLLTVAQRAEVEADRRRHALGLRHDLLYCEPLSETRRRIAATMPDRGGVQVGTLAEQFRLALGICPTAAEQRRARRARQVIEAVEADSELRRVL